MKHQHPLQFDEVIERLRSWREKTQIQLRSPLTRARALEQKRQLDAAIGCLELCERHQIRPDAQVVTLPETQTRTPSSIYRVLEDNETDERLWWSELALAGEALHLYPGDLIVR